MCLGFHDEAIWQALSDAERQQLIDDSLAYERALRASGHVLDSKALEGSRTAITVRYSGGKATVTDGPFAETKEQLGGFMLLEAKDLNHAIQLMSCIPCMRVGGSIEIRPVNEAICAEAGGRDSSSPVAGISSQQPADAKKFQKDVEFSRT
jgi:hypothetical protein